MARVKGGYVTRQRRKRTIKLAKGYYGAKSLNYKMAKQQVMKSHMYAFRDRKQTKRNFRRLWITRINAAARQNDISYSRLMNGLKKAGIEMNRKMLAEVAVHDADAFAQLCEQAKAALA
ncbi:50S ribosomal protein L20 [Falseniella ignava]|uniref:Large ribosomal subunit protein bL20 n=2 Tax=Falseniella ignava TaxID=137730 RepID=K1LUS2_9LACT|nr:50S ribosomal protein L20 [Falseniella ignava]EKB53743.1 50S ribosomal protein L20 [Falseniella ignava CCUG 37419]PKY88650.1 50S ribosomal protein L20 [Falseniella ignava]